MKKLFTTLAALILTIPLYGQKIETRDPNEHQIVQVKTALNHLTVIQLAEPVLSVAAGSDAFKVEWRADQVFIEPTEAGVSTNLFIWTKSGRENYELDPAGPLSAMDFAIDTRTADPAPAPRPKPARKASTDPVMVAAVGMLRGTPVRQEMWKTQKHRVQVMVRDLFEESGKLFIRYSIENGTRTPYAPGTPHMTVLKGSLSHGELTAHVYTQLTRREDENLIGRSEARLPVIAHEVSNTTVLPGQETIGVVGVKLQSSTTVVLRLRFRDDHGRAVTAAVVN